MATNNKKSTKNKKVTSAKKTKRIVKKNQLDSKDILIQAGLALYFTLYFISFTNAFLYNENTMFIICEQQKIILDIIIYKISIFRRV